MTDYKSELEFYKKALYEDVLPFREKYSPDYECGGVDSDSRKRRRT